MMKMQFTMHVSDCLFGLRSWMTALLFHLVVLLSYRGAKADPLRNVLLIIIDDLRPQLYGAYDMKMMKMPALGRLASESVVFTRAYVQMPVCSPSRNSFMTGRRPERIDVLNSNGDFRQTKGDNDWISMSEWFKHHGYLTYGAGKFYHPNSPPDNDFLWSWMQDDFNPTYWGNNATFDAGYCDPLHSESSFPISDWHPMNISTVYFVRDNSESGEYEHFVASRTIVALQHVQKANKYFLIATDFIRPHGEYFFIFGTCTIQMKSSSRTITC